MASTATRTPDQVENTETGVDLTEIQDKTPESVALGVEIEARNLLSITKLARSITNDQLEYLRVSDLEAKKVELQRKRKRSIRDIENKTEKATKWLKTDYYSEMFEISSNIATEKCNLSSVVSDLRNYATEEQIKENMAKLDAISDRSNKLAKSGVKSLGDLKEKLDGARAIHTSRVNSVLSELSNTEVHLNQQIDGKSSIAISEKIEQQINECIQLLDQ